VKKAEMIAIVLSDGADDLHDKQVFSNLLRGKVVEDPACVADGVKCGWWGNDFGVPCCKGTCKGFGGGMSYVCEE
jgi:hypothetical protein